MDELLRVLILDDNSSDAELQRRELRKAGFRFTDKWAPDKKSYLEALDAEAPDVILADYSLPGFDGLSAMALAKQRFPGIPVIIVSGAIGEEIAIEALKAGATDYVLKERLSRLGSVVQRAVQEACRTREKKLAEEELQRLAQHRQLALDAAQMGWWHYDAGTKSAKWDERFRQIFELTGFEGPDEEVQKKIHPEDLPGVRESFDAALNTVDPKPYAVEHRVVHRDGTVLWVEGRGLASFDGEGEARRATRLVGTVLDITVRKRTLEALRESEERLRLAVEAAGLGTWDLRLDGSMADGRVLRYSKHLGPMFAGDEGFEYQSVEAAASRLPADDRSRVAAEFAEAVRCNAEFNSTFRAVSNNGDIRWLSARGAILRDEAGRPVRAIGIAQDITERKLAEDTLNSARASAERAKAEAERANAAKDQFLAVLSHELRTPLAPVLAGISLIRRKQCAACGMGDELEIIQRNVQLEARLIDDLLDLTRIERGKINLERRRIYLCTVLGRVAQVCRADIEARRLHFNLEIENGPHCVTGDDSRLQQIFWNLLNNAVKFTPDGGSILMHSRREDGQVVVDVSDTGIGVEPEAARRIFDAFEQANTRVTQQFGGLGLGLAITKRLVELHGGSVAAFSRGKGRGATFRVILPISHAQADMEPEKTAVSFAQSARKILLVEDHADTARMMKQLLEMSGYEVDTAADVAQGLEATAEKRFDLLISDIGLPDKSGLQLMEELRLRGSVLKGIALSGYGREDDVRRSIEAGFSAHLTKPVDLDALMHTVRQITADRM